MSTVSKIINLRLLNIKIGNYRFQPGVVITIVTIVVAYILFSLGQWQLSRAEYKENLQEKIAQRQFSAERSIQQLPDSLEDRRYLPVKLQGHYNGEKQFLLDNRIVNGVVGYDVYTPFIAIDGTTILVNRGFIEVGRNRQVLPDLTVSDKKITISGLLNLPPSKGVILADNLHSSEKWPVVLQYIDLNELSDMLSYQLMDMVIRLNKDENGALTYHLPVLALNADKNHGYAFQWFAMTLTVCLLYLFLNTKKISSTSDTNEWQKNK